MTINKIKFLLYFISLRKSYRTKILCAVPELIWIADVATARFHTLIQLAVANLE